MTFKSWHWPASSGRHDKAWQGPAGVTMSVKTRQCLARSCKTRQGLACSCKVYGNVLQDVVRLCKVLQGRAIFCKVLQSMTMLCKVPQGRAKFCKVLQGREMLCKVLQGRAMLCKLLWDGASCFARYTGRRCETTRQLTTSAACRPLVDDFLAAASHLLIKPQPTGGADGRGLRAVVARPLISRFAARTERGRHDRPTDGRTNGRSSLDAPRPRTPTLSTRTTAPHVGDVSFVRRAPLRSNYVFL